MKMTAKRHPRGVQGVQNEPKGIPEASQRSPEGTQERQRSVQEAQSSIYSCFIAFSSDQGHPAECGVEP